MRWDCTRCRGAPPDGCWGPRRCSGSAPRSASTSCGAAAGCDTNGGWHMPDRMPMESAGPLGPAALDRLRRAAGKDGRLTVDRLERELAVERLSAAELAQAVAQ